MGNDNKLDDLLDNIQDNLKNKSNVGGGQLNSLLRDYESIPSPSRISKKSAFSIKKIIFWSFFFITTILFAAYYIKAGVLVQVKDQNGLVLINGEKKTELSFFKKKDLIQVKGKDAYLDVELYGGHVVRFREGKFKIVGKTKKNTLIVIKGKIFAAVNKFKKPSPFFVTTPTSVVGVRGTKFMVEEKAHETYMCVCEGSIVAKKRGKSTDKRIVRRGYDFEIHQFRKLKSPVASPDMVEMIENEFIDMGF